MIEKMDWHDGMIQAHRACVAFIIQGCRDSTSERNQFLPASTGELCPDLNGHTALVTGASRGIGRAIAISLGGCGADLILASRSEAELQETADAVRGAGGTATAIITDMDSEAQIVALFERVHEQGALDILVNNAGVGRFGKVVDVAAEDLDQVMQTNLRGPFLCCREAMKLMVLRASGYIINVSSVVGFKGYPEQAAYAASKHAIMGLTKSLAAEAQAHGIRVSAICPGGVDTELVAQARPDLDRSILMAPEDIAHTVLFLLSLSGRNAAVDEIYIRRTGSAPF